VTQGKYLEIMFDSYGQPVGAQITNYLLEKVSARPVEAPTMKRGSNTWHDHRIELSDKSEESVIFISSTSSQKARALRSEVGAPQIPDTSADQLKMYSRHLPEMFGLQGPEAYLYTSASKTLDVASINDVSDFAETLVSG
jgi:myosin-1